MDITGYTHSGYKNGSSETSFDENWTLKYDTKF